MVVSLAGFGSFDHGIFGSDSSSNNSYFDIEIIILFKKLEAQKMGSDYIIPLRNIFKDFFYSLREITDINQRQDFSYSGAELIKTITNKGDLNLYFEDNLDVFVSVDNNIKELRTFLSAFKNCLSRLNSTNDKKEKFIQLFIDLMKVINQEDGFDENLKSATTIFYTFEYIFYTFEYTIINSSVHDCFFDLIKFIVDQPLDISRNINSLASFSLLIRRFQSDNKTEKILFFEDIEILMKNFVKEKSEPLTEQLEQACEVLTSDYAKNLRGENIYDLVQILSGFRFTWRNHLTLDDSLFDVIKFIVDQPLNKRDIRKNIKSLKDFTQLISIIGNQIKENRETEIQLLEENIKKIMESFVNNKSEPLIAQWQKASNTLRSFYPKDFRVQEIHELERQISYKTEKQPIHGLERQMSYKIERQETSQKESVKLQQETSQQPIEKPILRQLKDSILIKNIQLKSTNFKLAEAMKIDLVSTVSNDTTNYMAHKIIDPQLELSESHGKNFSKGQQKQEPISYAKQISMLVGFFSNISLVVLVSNKSTKIRQFIQKFKIK